MGTPVPFQTAHASQSAQALLVSFQASESTQNSGRFTSPGSEDKKAPTCSFEENLRER